MLRYLVLFKSSDQEYLYTSQRLNKSTRIGHHGFLTTIFTEICVTGDVYIGINLSLHDRTIQSILTENEYLLTLTAPGYNVKKCIGTLSAYLK
jgi:hypothetical protein